MASIGRSLSPVDYFKGLLRELEPMSYTVLTIIFPCMHKSRQEKGSRQRKYNLKANVVMHALLAGRSVENHVDMHFLGSCPTEACKSRILITITTLLPCSEQHMQTEFHPCFDIFCDFMSSQSVLATCILAQKHILHILEVKCGLRIYLDKDACKKCKLS